MAQLTDTSDIPPNIPLGLTFDDVLLQPLESSVLPSQADTRTFLTREIPLVEKSGKLCGILTHRDVRFVENPRQPVSELMTKDNLATVPIGTSEAEARRILHQRRIEKLLVVDEDNHCVGLITVKDIEK